MALPGGQAGPAWRREHMPRSSAPAGQGPAPIAVAHAHQAGGRVLQGCPSSICQLSPRMGIHLGAIPAVAGSPGAMTMLTRTLDLPGSRIQLSTKTPSHGPAGPRAGLPAGAQRDWSRGQRASGPATAAARLSGRRRAEAVHGTRAGSKVWMTPSASEARCGPIQSLPAGELVQ